MHMAVISCCIPVLGEKLRIAALESSSHSRRFVRLYAPMNILPCLILMPQGLITAPLLRMRVP